MVISASTGSPACYQKQSLYSDTGEYGGLLDAVPTEPASLAAVARNVIVHYRAYAKQVNVAHRSDIHLRWLGAILARDAQRHYNQPLAATRALAERVQGCCRDHTLFCVGALRHHGIAARSRVGFASYLTPGWNHDHVIVERHNGARWVRFNPKMPAPQHNLAAPFDIPAGRKAPFATAAEVWRAYRAGEIEPDTYGVAPKVPIGGPWFIQCYVFLKLAHHMGDELLLWDGWGDMADPHSLTAEQAELADEIAALLVEADAGEVQAEAELARRYADDVRLRPGETVVRIEPDGSGESVVERVGSWQP